MFIAKKKHTLYFLIFSFVSYFYVFCNNNNIVYADIKHATDYTYLLKPHFQFLDLPELDSATDTKNTPDYVFKTPHSRHTILKKFCALKTNPQKQSYIDTLNNIVKNGKNFQKRINYNDEAERSNKRKDENDPKFYRIDQEPHTEAAYHLGVIYAFSQCGMQNPTQAIDFFQQAYNKPETYFMIAEFYREYYPKTHQRRIYYLYNDAIKSGIVEAHYNLALYIYTMLKTKNIASKNPSNFNYQTILNHLRTVAISNPIAQNDFAVLLHKTKPNILEKKLYSLMNLYFEKASKQKLTLADYNQIILVLSEECSKDKQKFLQNKVYGLQKKHPVLLNQILPLIQTYQCDKKNN